jgi:hypothetical protein
VSRRSKPLESSSSHFLLFGAGSHANEGYADQPGFGRFLVALPPVRDLIFYAKHLLVAAMVAIAPAGGSNGSSSALSSDQDLASIPR